MLDFIAIPMGAILKFLYDNLAFQNYGIAIILFTVGIKSLLLPPREPKQWDIHRRFERIEMNISQLSAEL